MPASQIPGLHHITVVAGPAQENVDFYAGVLGLRLVKTTVNFDDPGTYHLYYGDASGSPGTLFTAFPWAQAVQGRSGAGMARTTAFAIPEGTRAAWHQRLKDAGVTTSETTRFAETRLQVTAPDGLPLALIETAPVETPTADAPSGGSGSDVPDRLAIRGFHSTTLPAPEAASLHALLTDVFGWTKVATDDAYTRFAAPSGGIGTVVDVHERPSHASGRMGKGTVHHVAFRARTPDEQAHWQQLLRTRGINVTDVKDRRYFQSIYFRDATWTAGILFEIATDAPGFLADDETPDTLGTTLQLPPELEERRAELEDRLPPLARPQTA